MAAFAAGLRLATASAISGYKGIEVGKKAKHEVRVDAANRERGFVSHAVLVVYAASTYKFTMGGIVPYAHSKIWEPFMLLCSAMNTQLAFPKPTLVSPKCHCS